MGEHYRYDAKKQADGTWRVVKSKNGLVVETLPDAYNSWKAATKAGNALGWQAMKADSDAAAADIIAKGQARKAEKAAAKAAEEAAKEAERQARRARRAERWGRTP